MGAIGIPYFLYLPFLLSTAPGMAGKCLVSGCLRLVHEHKLVRLQQHLGVLLPRREVLR